MKKLTVTDLLLLALSALFFVGTLTFLRACGLREDGGWMTCHWAGQSLKGLAAALTALALLRLFAGPKVKIGLSLGAMPLCLLAAATPGTLISLCGMADMRCRSVMKPGALVCAVLILAAAVADIFVQRKKER